MKIAIIILAASLLATSTHAQQQDPAEMQHQMALADAPQSAANTTAYKTPLQTFNKYFDSLKTPNLKAHLDCLTDRLRHEDFQEEAGLTDQQLAARDAQAAQSGYSQMRLDSFVFTADPYRPQITIMTSAVESQVRVTETIKLTLIDTAFGWKIDDDPTTATTRASASP